MLTVNILVFNPFEENTYIVVDKATGHGIVVDPGMFVARERQEFDDYVRDNDITLDAIVNTHMHLDHSFGINYVKEKYGIKLAAHLGDEQLALSLHEQGMRFGFAKRDDQPVTIDVAIGHGDTIKVGSSEMKVLHVPGHSQGGVAIYSADDGFALVGDSIFRGSIGRTDLPGGDRVQLIESIRSNLLTLPDDTVLLPGHGPHTTVATELVHNPYL